MIVPTLILPRDDELETLGRTVEQTLGRSVKSIDVIGRGKETVVSILFIVTDVAFLRASCRPAEQGKLIAHLCLETCMLTINPLFVLFVDIRCCHAGRKSSHCPRCRLAYAYAHHGIRGPSLFSRFAGIFLI